MPQQLDSVPLRDGVDPGAVFAELSARHPHTFWLDAGPDAAEGWSWVGAGTPEPDGSGVRAVRVDQHSGNGDVGPFTGGWVGWVGYETGAAAAGAPVATAGGGAVPAELWLRVDDLYAFSHATGRAWALSRTGRAREHASRADAAPALAAPPPARPARARARHRPDEYAALIERCRAHIREGDAYQLCLTTRFEVAGAVDPLAAYERLRAATSSHHGAMIRSGDAALLSASPERFLEISGGVVRTHPIKGTRPRGGDAPGDRALVDELRADPKERAENVMIVDLMRNDLSRVSVPGSVRAERLLEVETYPTLHQLVSTVSGTLSPGTTLGHVLGAAFPAGSMTGAPKLSAMTILSELEERERGVFAGCFGWVGDDGAADLAMVIRSIVTYPGGAYIGAGGGITWRSRAAAEVAEVGLKARAPLAAVGAQVPPGWDG
ncbi:anthranilate synthase component I family protein [Microbacterium sp. RD1]|uniref:anthranilate synthase component I family protein n=1 Tax=Microbacterium sp. RD1 TaxID=3457313 RepID=UPI003FA525A5